MKSKRSMIALLVALVAILFLYISISAQPPPPPDVIILSDPIRLRADPVNITADGISTSRITADVVWPEGYDILTGTPACLVNVSFYTTLGDITPYGITTPTPDNQSCIAIVTLRAGTEPGTATITAWADIAPNETSLVRNSTTVNFLMPPVFDTESPAHPYPSISGTHNGTITPSCTIRVSTLYTYPCAGTGGHTEYVEIWNNSDWDITARWNGYTDDWHNITFNESFVLFENETYNYTIQTGSYPQIHHNRTLLTDNGWINCTEFVDANGKKYNNWIPAIRLE